MTSHSICLFRSIMGSSPTRAVKSCSLQCRAAAARSLCLCRVEARWLYTPSTPVSWSPCWGATTTMLTAASFTQTTRWDNVPGIDCALHLTDTPIRQLWCLFVCCTSPLQLSSYMCWHWDNQRLHSLLQPYVIINIVILRTINDQ